jgi:YD repeat-containing protein
MSGAGKMVTGMFQLFRISGIVLALLGPAMAQSQLPQMRPIKDATGKQVGTATRSGNRFVIRDANGELLGTIVVNADGTETRYDPHGNIVER